MTAAPHDDRLRFEQLFAATNAPLLGYLVRRSDRPEDAADLLAEVFLVAWRRIRDAPPGDDGRLWLYGVARKALANQRRRSRVETGLATELAAALRVQLPAHEPAEDARLAGLGAALASLGEGDRELLTLTAWEQLSPAEIAVVLHRPVGVVRVRLHRARARLRARLAQPAPGATIAACPQAAD